MDRLPEEFRQRMERMLGAEYGDFLASYERPRRGGLRLNALKQGSDRLLLLKDPESIPFTSAASITCRSRALWL